MRRGAQGKKRDGNESQIIEALCDIGLIPFQLSGAGMPDLLVYDPWANRNSAWQPIEVKNGNGKLTPEQEETSRRAKFPIVRSVEEALALYTHRVI